MSRLGVFLFLVVGRMRMNFIRGPFLSRASGLPLGVPLSGERVCGFGGASLLLMLLDCIFCFVVDVVNCMLVFQKKIILILSSYLRKTQNI